MHELRFNVLTRDWVIFAPERSRRPEQFHGRSHPQTHERPPFQAGCPFCPGSEDSTPGETARLQGEEPNRLVRAFPNRYPALSPGERGRPGGSDLQRSLSGVGHHEVVCESPLHNTTLGLMSEAEVLAVLSVWLRRYRELLEDPATEHVIVFQNHGPGAGTSLEHPHSQIVSLPVLPAQVFTRLEEAARAYNDRGGCLVCEMLEEERRQGQRIVLEGEEFTALVPYAAFSPYSVWIIPHRHRSCFGQTPDAELSDLARVLREVLARFYRGFEDPDYNLVVRSLAPNVAGRFFHWYLALVPRLGKAAGFELGTGMFINSNLPEADAQRLREL